MKLDAVNHLSQPAFVELLGGIYEHSPWVAERVWHKHPFHSRDELSGLMRFEVEGATTEEQLALLRAHPDLGTRAKISDASTAEQAGVGLDRLTTEEFERLTALNASYKDKFGFPFLYAVKGSDKFAILEALAKRLESDRDEELAEALHQVFRIAKFRLEDLLDDHHNAIHHESIPGAQ